MHSCRLRVGLGVRGAGGSSSPPEQERETPPACLPCVFGRGLVGSQAAPASGTPHRVLGPSPAQGQAGGQWHCPAKLHPCPSSASTRGYPKLSCPPAPLQRVPDSPAWWEEVAETYREHGGGLPASLQPQPTPALGFLRTLSDPNKVVQVLMTPRPYSGGKCGRQGCLDTEQTLPLVGPGKLSSDPLCCLG